MQGFVYYSPPVYGTAQPHTVFDCVLKLVHGQSNNFTFMAPKIVVVNQIHYYGLAVPK
jgi:hypothetical protein